jgi:preprotein translocase subunit YajC
MTYTAIVAQAEEQPAAPTQPQPISFFSPPIFGLLLAFAVFYFFIIRSQRRERQKQINMLNSLKRNDRVQTVGGIIGTIVDVTPGEVVLKVDEANNVKMRFVRSAVKEVVRDAAAAKEGGEKK